MPPGRSSWNHDRGDRAVILFAAPAPPSHDQNLFLAVLLGLFGWAFLSMVFRRLRSRFDPSTVAKRISMAAAGGALIAALAGPVALHPDAMAHWIGYNIEGAILRGFGGAVAGMVIAALAIRWIGIPTPPASQFGRSQFRLSSLLLLTTYVALLCAIFFQSAEVALFVVIQLAVMVGAFHIRVHYLVSRCLADEGERESGIDRPDEI